MSAGHLLGLSRPSYRALQADPAGIGTLFRHTLRATLRECRYLPNAQARRWIPCWILGRYRKWRGKRGQELLRDASLLRKQLAEARKQLSRLQRANQGERVALTKVLMLSYGRVGQRQHELIRELEKQEDHLADRETNTSAQNQWLNMHANKYPRQIHSKIIALQAAQAESNHQMFNRRQMMTIKPHLPKLNAWNLPMPECRLRNKRKRFLSEALHCLMAPLPEDEQQELSDLVEGRLRSSFKPRPTNSPVLWEASEERQKRPGQRHVLSDRHLRRILYEVWFLCPIIALNESTGLWRVRWPKRSKVPIERLPADDPAFG